MNYSDYDSDGYSSNEDADYVPSDDNLSEDDLAECEKEEPLHVNDDVPHPGIHCKKEKKKTKSNALVRKKKKCPLNVGEEDGTAAEATQPQQNKLNEGSDDVTQKKKSDELWASFLSDVGTRPKDTAPQSSSKQAASVSKAPLATEPKVESAKVTITKVFDFAGEEVRVNKEVSADSKEAKKYLKEENAKEKENEEQEELSSSTQISQPPSSSAKRPAGMSSLLDRIGGKKPKMSTLEKSKMDWDAFKQEEGISEELAIHNRGKDGYVERKNFLERVDHRQFELEKAVRLSNMKR